MILLDQPEVAFSVTAFMVLTVVALITKQLTDNIKSKKKIGSENDDMLLGLDRIPGVKPFLPIKLFGNFFDLLPMSKAIATSIKWCQENPGLFKLTGANQIIVVLNSPQLLQQLYRSSDFGHNVKAPMTYSQLRPYLTNSLVVSNGKFWQQQKKILLKTANVQHIKMYIGIINKKCIQLVTELDNLFKDGKPHEINNFINMAFLRIVCEIITGYDTSIPSSDFDSYHQKLHRWKEIFIRRILYPWLMFKPIWKLHPLSKEYDNVTGELFKFTNDRIKDRKEKLALESSSTKHITDDEDKPVFRSALDELLEAGLAENQIVDEINGMIVGGHDTGSTIMHFFCFCVATYQNVQETCRQEVDELFNDSTSFQNGCITYEAVSTKLKYVERCLQETMRLFPPGFVLFRKMETPLKLEEKGNTFLVPSGTTVIIPIIGIHRSPVYYPEPDVFDPNRFLPDEVAKRPSYSFLPFSGGPRICIAFKFAYMELKMLAAYIIRNFEITTTDRMEDVCLLPSLIMEPAKDFTFMLTKRAFVN